MVRKLGPDRLPIGRGERLVVEPAAGPDLAQDVSVRGITLVGGVAQMTDVAELLTREVGVECRAESQPDLVVLRGLLRCVNEVSALRRTSRNFDD